jgi:AcrR family transcriptional regulator
VSERTRPYRSPVREEQARRTRRRIVDAAAELFVERGYAATTIDAIAERAGVGRKTVFNAVGGKAALLKLAFDWTLAGDDEPVAIADRPEVRRMFEHDDPHRVLEEWIAMNAHIARRLAALHHVLAAAADSDPDAAALLATTDKQRIDGATSLMTRIDELGGLRDDLDIARAAAIVDVLIDPMPYRRLVDTRKWSFDDYVAELQRLAAVSILR